MPSKTFNKLPRQKQVRIISALIREFSRFDFHNASIDRIATDAQVAKGSFYQYFSGKRQMYSFALHEAIESYRQALKNGLAGAKNLPDAMAELTKKHFTFMYNHPHEAGLLYNSRQPCTILPDEDNTGDTEDGENGEAGAEAAVQQMRRKLLLELLEKHCRHLSRPEHEFLSFVLNETFNGCEMFVQTRGKFVLQDYMHDMEPELPLPKDQTDLLAYMMSASCAMLARTK